MNLANIDNKYKPLLCDMVECEYKKVSEYHNMICDLYLHPEGEDKNSWCSGWDEIDPFKIFVFLRKIGQLKGIDE